MRSRPGSVEMQTRLLVEGSGRRAEGYCFDAPLSLVDLLNTSDGMPSPDSLTTIERRIKELQAQAEAIRRNEQDGMEQLRAVIEKYKLGLAHLKMAMGGMGKRRSTRIRPKSKAAPKYRSLDNPAIVWSGRGRRPSWIIAGLKNGRTIDQYLIRDAQGATPYPVVGSSSAPSEYSRQPDGTEPTAPIASNADGCAR